MKDLILKDLAETLLVLQQGHSLESLDGLVKTLIIINSICGIVLLIILWGIIGMFPRIK